MAPTSRYRTLTDYYADPCVRTRIREYCGAPPDGEPACAFLCAMSSRDGPHATWGRATRYPVGALDSLLKTDVDIARSMWDRSNLLLHLDVDYQNTTLPGEAFHHPAEVFFKLEPVVRAARHVFRRFDLPLYMLMTGRGYHFTGRVPLDSPIVDRLAALSADTPRWHAGVRARSPEWLEGEITPRHARAHAGAGMLVEYLTHLILRRAVPRSRVATVLNGTVVGSGIVGRECVSLDFSFAGDPLDLRHMRTAFSAYQKHRFRPDIVLAAAAERPPLIAVPRGREGLERLLFHGRDARHAARAARVSSGALPDVSAGASRLIDAYAASRLARAHAAFNAAPAIADERLEPAFRALRLDAQLPCVTRAFTAPNDLLLQPAVIQHVTRVLMADGWPPRDIAALVRSRYTSDFGWGRRWQWLDPHTRAEFDVRVFAGLLASGVDRGVDFNCRSAQEKGLCPSGGCPCDLRDTRARLLAMVGA